MAQEHKATIEKQIESWGAKKHLVSAKEYEDVLTQAMIDLIETDRHDNSDKKSASELVAYFKANASNKSQSYREVKQKYILALNHWEKALDADARFLRANKKFNVQAVITRIFTTLAVGFSIMLVYWVAHCIGIPMPLMRMPG
ncbi:hypothetical protein [Arsukibacterium indicum]|uniref:SMODS and SLOG-associating 2TM effector domain-containing protein n=1 Tax=Arsukibacterium indicum TaxID=2848612 RepID=A0ABS6MI50_9GAMM|nr:hypothetical protein [Arsukibacterium indicum]MBV2127907.1 hypothetical protein [Arsukibacterium indicum]